MIYFEMYDDSTTLTGLVRPIVHNVRHWSTAVDQPIASIRDVLIPAQCVEIEITRAAENCTWKPCELEKTVRDGKQLTI